MMNQQHIFWAAAAIAVVGLDIFVRLYRAPGRRDGFYRSLLETSEGVPQRGDVAGGADDASLGPALLEFFRQSFTSRHLANALAGAGGSMTGSELEKQVATEIAAKWNREMPINAIRRVIMILLGANLVEQRGDKLALTEAGWRLLEKIGPPAARPLGGSSFRLATSGGIQLTPGACLRDK